MPDMLVKLYQLPPLLPVIEAQAQQGITVRRALSPEKYIVTTWVDKHFRKHWFSESDIAFARQPVSCFVAIANEQLTGFACYDTTYKGFFGPTGVLESARGKGTGKALLLACLHDMYVQGYAYGIIGGAGPVDFYQKALGNCVSVVADSHPGVYKGILGIPRNDEEEGKDNAG